MGHALGLLTHHAHLDAKDTLKALESPSRIQKDLGKNSESAKGTAGLPSLLIGSLTFGYTTRAGSQPAVRSALYLRGVVPRWKHYLRCALMTRRCSSQFSRERVSINR